MTYDLTQLKKLTAIKAMRTRRAKIDAATAQATSTQLSEAEKKMSARASAAQKQSVNYLSDSIALLNTKTVFDQELAYIGQNSIWLERRARSLRERQSNLQDMEVKARHSADVATKQLALLQAREEVFKNVSIELSKKREATFDLREEEDTLDLFKRRVIDG